MFVNPIPFAVIVSSNHFSSDHVGLDVEFDPVHLVRDDRDSC